MYAYMYVKHVNHSTTLQNNFTEYKTIASLPCAVSGPGMGCYFRFHHIATRRSNPNLLIIGKSITYMQILNKLRHCNISKCMYVLCMYVCLYACHLPRHSICVLLHDTVARLEDIGILGQLHTYIHTYIHKLLVSGGANRSP